ncbi:hypothetical protein BAE44_0025339 [Dichanthelium oligosanthes]|uniref:Uncharacterized protein n=1 Tax=Dichanthelium oligosanthes TaxID=888268 RepID=A0A1E5UL93_9POAL|nr:hypothetical protein BAE44_0025339 [Dichanthelium oligosanthes]
MPPPIPPAPPPVPRSPLLPLRAPPLLPLRAPPSAAQRLHLPLPRSRATAPPRYGVTFLLSAGGEAVSASVAATAAMPVALEMASRGSGRDRASAATVNASSERDLVPEAKRAMEVAVSSAVSAGAASQ